MPRLGAAAFNYSPLMNALTAETAGVGNTASAIGVLNGLWQIGSLAAHSAVALVYSVSRSFDAATVDLAAGPAMGFGV